mmetsp:Transcript_68276/g.154544  ORF Transcript_68276/g.154544 Transcript_68276/m.154544 type:complete len:203 (-) Transcript_68276:127-735(-)
MEGTQAPVPGTPVVQDPLRHATKVVDVEPDREPAGALLVNNLDRGHLAGTACLFVQGRQTWVTILWPDLPLQMPEVALRHPLQPGLLAKPYQRITHRVQADDAALPALLDLDAGQRARHEGALHDHAVSALNRHRLPLLGGLLKLKALYWLIDRSDATWHRHGPVYGGCPPWHRPRKWRCRSSHGSHVHLWRDDDTLACRSR